MLVKNSLINSWATALAEIAVKSKKVSDFAEQASAIIELLKLNPDFVALLSVHQSSDKLRVKIISTVFNERDFDQDIINALKLMVESDLIFHARDIFKVLRKHLARLNSIMFGVVWSISELDDKTIKAIETKIGKKIEHTVKLINKIDTSLVGGVQVVVNGQNFDGSIKGKLADMRSSISNIDYIEE